MTLLPFVDWPDQIGPTHIWSQGPGPWPEMSRATSLPADIDTYCGIQVRCEGQWVNLHKRVLTAELLAHAPGMFEDRPFCRTCMSLLAAHPIPRCAGCRGAGDLNCRGVASEATA